MKHLAGPVTMILATPGHADQVPLWPPPAFGFTRLPIGIDRCIALEVADLWFAGIKTFSSCCGHEATAPAHIAIEGAADALRMEDLGYLRSSVQSKDAPDTVCFLPRSGCTTAPR